jgi:ribosome biogenesis GTPase A
MKENLRHVDLVVELRDARIPASSKNPEIEKLLEGKKRVILLGKSDMADPDATNSWLGHLSSRGIPVLAVDCRSGKGLRAFAPMVTRLLEPETEKRKRRGLVGVPLRLMAVGVPNVGKSSFINRMASAKRTRVEDRPGVTRGRQWVKIDGGMELLDMPGVLWPKFEEKRVGEHLAFTGAVKDDVTDTEALAARLLERLAADYPALLGMRYRLNENIIKEGAGNALLEAVGMARGMLLPGGEIHTERAAVMVLDEFRGGLIGRITLELPGTEGKK